MIKGKAGGTSELAEMKGFPLREISGWAARVDSTKRDQVPSQALDWVFLWWFIGIGRRTASGQQNCLVGWNRLVSQADRLWDASA